MALGTDEEGNPRGDAKYILVKDPNKSLVRLYAVPMNTFEDDDEGISRQAATEDGEGE